MSAALNGRTSSGRRALPVCTLLVVVSSACFQGNPNFPMSAATADGGRCLTVGIDHGPPAKLGQLSLALTYENGCADRVTINVTRLRLHALGERPKHELVVSERSAADTHVIEGDQSFREVVTFGQVDASDERICVDASEVNLDDPRAPGYGVGCIAIDRRRPWLTNEGVVVTPK